MKILNKIEQQYLYPSNLIVSDQGIRVMTVLGSCISVCLYDKELKRGGINHFMLPLWNGNGLASPKYGNVAIDKLVKNMELMNCDKNNLVAKIFGGSSLSIGTLNIGGKNIDLAKNMLSELGIKIVSESIGGNLGRKILFDTETGDVFMKFIKPQNK